MRKFASFALAALMMSPALLAQNPVPTETMGSYMKSPEQKAMECYGRGLKLKKKAEAEESAEKKAKLYTKAKDEFSKSVGYLGNFDGYLALGQTYLKLGQKGSALDACTHAQGLKPNNEEAKSCLEEARKKADVAESKPEGGR
jgi:cytochrome c-type biogenesis protein CcmH/NrfG